MNIYNDSNKIIDFPMKTDDYLSTIVNNVNSPVLTGPFHCPGRQLPKHYPSVFE